MPAGGVLLHSSLQKYNSRYTHKKRHASIKVHATATYHVRVYISPVMLGFNPGNQDSRAKHGNDTREEKQGMTDK